MKLTKEIRKKINAMDYEQMLRRWRNDPVGVEFFQGEVGEYFSQRMMKLKFKLSRDEWVRISKEVGW